MSHKEKAEDILKKIHELCTEKRRANYWRAVNLRERIADLFIYLKESRLYLFTKFESMSELRASFADDISDNYYYKRLRLHRSEIKAQAK